MCGPKARQLFLCVRQRRESSKAKTVCGNKSDSKIIINNIYLCVRQKRETSKVKTVCVKILFFAYRQKKPGVASRCTPRVEIFPRRVSRFFILKKPGVPVFYFKATRTLTACFILKRQARFPSSALVVCA